MSKQDLQIAEMSARQADAQKAIADDETKTEEERAEARFQFNKHKKWEQHYREQDAANP
jgi:hypothetical protein